MEDTTKLRMANATMKNDCIEEKYVCPVGLVHINGIKITGIFKQQILQRNTIMKIAGRIPARIINGVYQCNSDAAKQLHRKSRNEVFVFGNRVALSAGIKKSGTKQHHEVQWGKHEIRKTQVFHPVSKIGKETSAFIV
ncbi:MAG: hypothetical protein LW707_04415 [Sphingobacteriales bacterium]|nr:hypothetical protein [Sphingobacteriales bacterium]